MSELIGTTHFRRATIDRDKTDSEIVRLAFASETPVERDFGWEVLDCVPGACDLSRVSEGVVPFLYDHDKGKVIGKVVSAQMDPDRIGRAEAKWAGTHLAIETRQLVQERAIEGISFGYVIDAVEVEAGKRDGKPVVRVTKYTLLEISCEPVPADPKVGFNRMVNMKTNILLEAAVAGTGGGGGTAVAPVAAVTAPVVAVAATRDVGKETQEMFAAAKRFNRMELYEKAIAEGMTVEQFRVKLLDSIAMKPLGQEPIGLDQKEVRQYSMIRAITALANPKDQRAQEAAKFEFEVSEETAKRAGKQAQGILIPTDVLLAQSQKRDLTVGSATAGGNLKATELLAGSFIDVLRNRLVVRKAGATVLSGLVGDVAIPKLTTATSAFWVAENNAPTEGAPTFGQVTLNPKTIGAYVDISRRLTLQATPAVEGIVRNDLNLILAIAIDLAALHGSGASNQPTGVASQSGIGSVTGGAQGAAPTFQNTVDLEAAVANNNADYGSQAYITNSRVRAKLKTTLKLSTGTAADFVWVDGPVGEDGAPVGMVNGYRALVTNQVSNLLTKGTITTCSAIFFGNWNSLLIGEWGNLDMLVDPFTGSNAGTIRIRVLQDVDIAVRLAASFAAMLDALAN